MCATANTPLVSAAGVACATAKAPLRNVASKCKEQDRTGQILEYLEARDWTNTLAISKAVVGNKGTQKDVNPLLYTLEEEGKLERRSSPSKSSHKEWKLAAAQLSKDDGDSDPEDVNRFLSIHEERELERTSSPSTASRDRTGQILEYLEARDWTNTLTISKAVVGNKGTQRDVNPLLYTLEQEGKLERRSSPSKPSRKQWKLVTAPAPPEPSLSAGEHRQVHRTTEDVQPASKSQKELEERVAEALEDPKSFRSLAQSLKPPELSPSEAAHQQKILQVVTDLADERFSEFPGVAKLEQIGSKAYGVDIHGSDSDYALKMGEIPIYHAAWEKYVAALGQKLSPTRVELRNKSAAILVEDTMPVPVLEIVPFNAHFDEESVVFETLFGTGNAKTLNRAAADVMLKQLFEGYQGARDATRVAKAVFCADDTPSSTRSVPLGYLLTLYIYRACRRHKKEEDFSGVDLFHELLMEIHSWPAAGQNSKC